MIKLKLLALMLIVLGPCACAYARKGWGVGRALPAALCAQSLALIALGYVLPFSASLMAVAAVSGCAWVYALVRAKRFFSRDALLSFFLPCALSVLASIFLYDACIRRVFLSYDEYSHWGMIVKAISLFDELPRFGRGAAYVQYTYPPSAAMLPAMFTAVLGMRDGAACLGYAVLIFGLLFGLAAKASRRKGTALACAAAYLAMMAVFPMSILRLFVEPVAALLMALIMLGAWEDETPLWEELLYAAMLAMVKNTGLVFVLMTLLVRAFVRRDRAHVKRDALMFAASVLAAASYKAYCHVQGIAAVISPITLADNLAALKNGTLAPAYLSLPGRYLRFFFTQPLPDAGVYAAYGFGTCAAVFFALLLLCAVHVALCEDRKRALRLWGGVWLGNLLYIVMIVGSYYVGFAPEEVERLAESDRYTMLPALWTALLVCAMLVRACSVMKAKKRWAVLAVLCAALLPISHVEMTAHTFITRSYVDNTIWALAQTEEMAAFIRGNTTGEDKLLCVGDYEYEKLHYALAGHLDIGRMDAQHAFTPFEGDEAQLASSLSNGGYTHVFFAGLDSEDAQRFASAASALNDGEGLEPFTLYRTEIGPDGDAALAKIGAMPDQE